MPPSRAQDEAQDEAQAIRDRLALSMTEKHLQANVMDVLHAFGYFTHHERDSRGGSAGMPDIFAIKGTRILWIECKSQRGRTRPEQIIVMAYLRLAGQEVYVFRPNDWIDGTIERVLRDASGR